MSDFWGKAKEVLGLVAPSVGTALGGPLGGIAGTFLKTALNMPESASDGDLATAIAGANPEQLLAIKQAEFDFQKSLKALDIDLARIDASDRASARQRQAEMKDRMPGILAAMVFTGFFGILCSLMFVMVPEAATDPLNIMLGALGTLVVQIANYYFGSSSGSAQKQKMLDRVIGEGQGR